MLKNVSNTFIQNCNAKELTYSEYIVINNQQIPVRAKLSDDCYENGNFIGSFILKTIQFETSNDIDFKKKEFEYYKVVNGESIKIGTFITTEIQNNDTTELVKVIGMDYGLKTQVEYTSELNYDSGQITLLDVWNEACQLAGIQSGVQSFTNSDFIVDGDQFTDTGAMIRDVFVGIALSSGSFIKIGNDDKIYPVFTEQTNEIIEDYTELEDKRDTQPITCLRLGSTVAEGENVDITDPELIEEYGENWLILNDNPFAYNQTKRSQLITAIFNKVKGFGYSAFVSKTSFKPYLTCGDLVKFRNRNGNLVDTIILRYTHEYKEDDMQITLQAPSETSATVNYVYPLSAIDISKRTEIMVDKQNQVITSLSEEVGEYDDRITTVEQTVDRIEQTAVTYEDLKRNVHSLKKIYVDNAYPSYPLKLSIKNVQMLYPREDLYPSTTLYPLGGYLVIDNQETLSENAKFIKLPITTLNVVDTTYDEFIIEKQHAYIIRRIGVNQDGTLYILQNEIIEELGTVNVELFEGTNYIYLYSFKEDNVIYDMDYTIPSEFTDTFATEVYVNSTISQTANQIMLQVNEKVDEDEIIAKLNVAVEDGQGVINLTGNTVTIDSDNFKLDEEGNLDCNDAIMKDVTLQNGSIELVSSTRISAAPPSVIRIYNDDPRYNWETKLSSNGLTVEGSVSKVEIEPFSTFFTHKYDDNRVYIDPYSFIASNSSNSEYSRLAKNNITTTGYISADGAVYASDFINTSQEEKKKNIEELKDALSILKDINIYTYNYKTETKRNNKKHYGLVIGDKYKYSKEVTNDTNEGVNLYSLISICCASIKEQQQQIEELRKEIDNLKSKGNIKEER